MSILVLEHGRHAGIRRLGGTLLEHGHRLDIRRRWDGDDLPAGLEGIDGVVVMGGPESVAGTDPDWRDRECAMLIEAADRGLGVLGICLGSQVLARAFGGTVGRLPRRRLGWHDVVMTPEGREDPLLSGLPWTMNAFHHNADVVTELPAGARLLASGESGDVQVWRLGVRTWAFQFHPEIDLDSVSTWCEDDPAQLAEAGGDRASLESSSATFFPVYKRLTDRLFKAVAMLLMPLDARV